MGGEEKEWAGLIAGGECHRSGLEGLCFLLPTPFWLDLRPSPRPAAREASWCVQESRRCAVVNTQQVREKESSPIWLEQRAREMDEIKDGRVRQETHGH